MSVTKKAFHMVELHNLEILRFYLIIFLLGDKISVFQLLQIV